jgi:hypothetical protein
MVLVFKTNDLPSNSEAAFTVFEERARKALEEAVPFDRNQNSDHNGNYEGSYEPERLYVTAILAFLDEHSIETNIEDISELENQDFYKKFGLFKSKVGYISTRFRLRTERVANGSIGTVITIESTYKSEVGALLEKIRKIVNAQLDPGPKKDRIFKRISDLQSEVDRDFTTIDALFGRMIGLSKTIGECGENVKPAIDQLERIKKIFWDNSKKVDNLPKPDRQKSLPKPDQNDVPPVDPSDEIPF